jgi:hypothetical protein
MQPRKGSVNGNSSNPWYRAGSRPKWEPREGDLPGPPDWAHPALNAISGGEAKKALRSGRW